MSYMAELPDYRNKAYFGGNYSGFKYYTQLLKEREKICFLSGRPRNAEGASKFEMQYKKENDPNNAPGRYTPLLPSYTVKLHAKRPSPKVPIQKKETESSESLLSIEPKEPGHKVIPPKVEKKKEKIKKDGLIWSKRSVFKAAHIGPGPAGVNITRYPESLPMKPNKAPFNSTSVFKYPPTITTIAPKSSSDRYEHKDLFKSAFESTKELDIPIIICIKSLKDSCAKCKNKIDENYFYIKGSVFVCRKCYKDSINSKCVQEQTKMSGFKQARYCTRYHRHHKVRGFDKLIPNKNLYRLLIREIYHQQYTGGRFVDEGVPSKYKTKTSTKGSKIYQSLFSDSTYNTKELCANEGIADYNAEEFAHTFGSVRQIEPRYGIRRECLVCKPTPVFVFPHTCSTRAIFDVA